MYRVLLPVEGKVDRVREQVDAVAELPDAPGNVSVTILHVFEDSDIETSANVADATDLKAVTVAKEFLEEQGIEVTIDSRGGAVGTSIIHTAEETDANSIFISGPKRSPASKALFGSVAQFTILNANRPVMVTTYEEN